MSFKEFIKDYFSFSQQEKRGIFVLLIILLFVITAPFIYKLFLQKPNQQYNISIVKEQILAFEKELQDDTNQIVEVFDFNPNTIDSIGLLKLGFSPKQTHVFLNYRRKGGKFYKKQDVNKIYSVSDEMYALLAPYIVIEKQPYIQKQDFKNRKTVNLPEKLDLNNANAQDFIDLGIDKRIAWRIVNFRKALGGFHTFSQLNEVYDITKNQLMILKMNTLIKSQIYKKINMNKTSLHELKKHPYLRNKASAVLHSQQQHPFDDVHDLVRRKIFTEEEFKKLQYYIEVDSL